MDQHSAAGIPAHLHGAIWSEQHRHRRVQRIQRRRGPRHELRLCHAGGGPRAQLSTEPPSEQRSCVSRCLGPPIEQGRAEAGPNGGFIAHQFIGENNKPLLKIEDFDRTMRGGMGRQVDVASSTWLR